MIKSTLSIADCRTSQSKFIGSQETQIHESEAHDEKCIVADHYRLKQQIIASNRTGWALSGPSQTFLLMCNSAIAPDVFHPLRDRVN
jgi:hypothetical protein